MDQELCGKWMPRAEAYCSRGAGHPPGHCASPEAMEAQRRRGHAARRLYDPVAARRWRKKFRLSRYGLTQEMFDLLLEAQGYACAMCRTPFEDGQPVFIDHDHACCPDEKSSCGRCVRGVLDLLCNIAVGYIEKYGEMARVYLAARG